MRQLSFIAALWFSLAAAQPQTPDPEIQKLQQQIQKNPKDSGAHYQLAEIYFQKNNLQTAANEYRQALNGDLLPNPVEVLAHLGLAKVFDLTGQTDRAENERRQATRAGNTPIALPAVLHAPAVPVPILQTGPEYSEEGRAAGLE